MELSLALESACKCLSYQYVVVLSGEDRESGHRTISGFRTSTMYWGPLCCTAVLGIGAGSPLARPRPPFFLTFRLVPARRNSCLGSETLLQPMGPVKRETPHMVSPIMTG